MLIVQDQVWGRVTANRSVGKSTRYYADEFHLLLKDEQTAAYSVEIWKRFRKWGGIPTALTQNVKDLLASPEVSNIFENSDFVYMLNIRLINSHYDDLYRIPDSGVIQVDYPDGRSFTARVEHLDDYHFDMGGLGNVFHICQFAEVMERNHADFYPEIQTQDEQAAWELGGKGYLAIQSCEDGWDYTLYHSDYSVMDGGQLDAPELTIQEAREQILEAHHMEKGRRLLQDYDAVMNKVAEAEELSADHRPSTLEKLAELASDTSAPKSSARSAPEL